MSETFEQGRQRLMKVSQGRVRDVARGEVCMTLLMEEQASREAWFSLPPTVVSTT